MKPEPTMTDDFFDTVPFPEPAPMPLQPSRAKLVGLFLLSMSSFVMVGLLCLVWWWLS